MFITNEKLIEKSWPHDFKNVEIVHFSLFILENVWSEVFELENPCGLSIFCNLQNLVELDLVLLPSNSKGKPSFSHHIFYHHII